MDIPPCSVLNLNPTAMKPHYKLSHTPQTLAEGATAKQLPSSPYFIANYKPLSTNSRKIRIFARRHTEAVEISLFWRQPAC